MLDSIDDLLNPLKREVAALIQYNATGASDYSNYLRTAGNIEGLQQAIDIIKETLKKRFKDVSSD